MFMNFGLWVHVLGPDMKCHISCLGWRQKSFKDTNPTLVLTHSLKEFCKIMCSLVHFKLTSKPLH